MPKAEYMPIARHFGVEDGGGVTLLLAPDGRILHTGIWWAILPEVLDESVAGSGKAGQ